LRQFLHYGLKISTRRLTLDPCILQKFLALRGQPKPEKLGTVSSSVPLGEGAGGAPPLPRREKSEGRPKARARRLFPSQIRDI